MDTKRAINRLELLKPIAILRGSETEEAVDMAIEALKAEQQKWIPASERLPELFVNVLVYGTFGFEIMHIEEANYNGGVEWCNDHDYFVPVHNTLWMELHEPFEVENADGEDGEQE